MYLLSMDLRFVQIFKKIELCMHTKALIHSWILNVPTIRQPVSGLTWTPTCPALYTGTTQFLEYQVTLELDWHVQDRCAVSRTWQQFAIHSLRTSVCWQAVLSKYIWNGRAAVKSENNDPQPQLKDWRTLPSQPWLVGFWHPRFWTDYQCCALWLWWQVKGNSFKTKSRDGRFTSTVSDHLFLMYQLLSTEYFHEAVWTCILLHGIVWNNQSHVSLTSVDNNYN